MCVCVCNFAIGLLNCWIGLALSFKGEEIVKLNKRRFISSCFFTPTSSLESYGNGNPLQCSAKILLFCRLGLTWRKIYRELKTYGVELDENSVLFNTTKTIKQRLRTNWYFLFKEKMEKNNMYEVLIMTTYCTLPSA